MSHEMPFKKLIWKFSWEAYSRNFSRVSLTHETIAKQLQNSLSKLHNWALLMKFFAGKPYSQNYLRKHLENLFFTHKQLEKLWRHGWYKSLPKANKKNKNLFNLIHIWMSTHISHLNMYKHTNEIGIH